MMRITVSLLVLLAGPALGQDFGVDDGASGSADSIGRASGGDFDGATGGVGAAAKQDHDGVDGAEFDEDTAAVGRTFNESAGTGLDSPEGTLQESSAIVNGILD